MGNKLFALVVVGSLLLIVEVAGVFHGDSVAGLRLVAITLLDDLLGDAHGCCCARELSERLSKCSGKSLADH